MSEQQTNYDKLQHCSGQISRLIALEEKYRNAKIDIEGEELVFPLKLTIKLKQKFSSIRADVINVLSSITG